MESWVIECLQECTKYAKKNDVIIVVKIINRYEVDFCKKVNDVIDLIKVAGFSMILFTIEQSIDDFFLHSNNIDGSQKNTY